MRKLQVEPTAMEVQRGLPTLSDLARILPNGLYFLFVGYISEWNVSAKETLPVMFKRLLGPYWRERIRNPSGRPIV